MFIAVTEFVGLNVNSIPLYAIPMKCVSMSNQECKLFYPLSILVNINVVVVVIILIISTLNYVLLMLSKT